MRELMSYLPENYPDSRETVAFQEALQPEVNILWETRDDFLAQLNPYRATWGLNYWEDALGLRACQGLLLDTRRRQVVAKLQGRATTTPAVIQTVAETLLGFKVKVIEYFSEYRVELEVDSGGMLPAGVPQLKERLREIMPAHLDWGLVLPTWNFIPIRAALGPRIGRSAPPAYRAQLPPGKIHAAAALGIRYSTVTLPLKEAKADGL
ncbi:MAG: DUF2313 domain-containing protein [Clostridiales bacterium]|nr:DUF2313 domain-containing protein [Clostridiales bacterium]